MELPGEPLSEELIEELNSFLIQDLFEGGNSWLVAFIVAEDVVRCELLAVIVGFHGAHALSVLVPALFFYSHVVSANLHPVSVLPVVSIPADFDAVDATNESHAEAIDSTLRRDQALEYKSFLIYHPYETMRLSFLILFSNKCHFISILHFA